MILPAAFWNRVDKSDSCWVWLGAKTSEGYGRFESRTAQVKGGTHRLAYEAKHGPIPAGLEIDHMCHNRSCVNPDHLRAVTRSQNAENRRGADVDSLTGVRNVSWNKRQKHYAVRVCSKGVYHWGGSYSSLDEAAKAAQALRNQLFTHNIEHAAA